jgi:hypothetical protein
MADPDLGKFEGWTDDTFWNGWLNVEVEPDIHFAILGRIAVSYGNERLAQDGVHHPAEDTDSSYAIGLWEALSGLEQLKPNDWGRYSYANCYCTREAVELSSR